MAFQLSPGVNVTEKDVTLIVPAVATTPAAFVGPFRWGPANEPVLVQSQSDLVSKFGTPLVEGNYEKYWWTASNFLAYGNNLRVVRTLDDSYKTASTHTVTPGVDVSEANGVWSGVFNDDSYDDWVSTNPTLATQFVARYPGSLGNSLSVVIIDNGYDVEGLSTDGTPTAEYRSLFDDVPSTTLFMETKTGSIAVNDEIHIFIIDKDGSFTGTAGTVLESFRNLSKSKGARTEGGVNNYYVSVINSRSEYVRWGGAHPTTTSSSTDSSEWGTEAQDVTSNTVFESIENGFKEYTLSGGTLGTSITDPGNDISEYWDDHFADGSVDVSLLIAGPVSNVVAKEIIEVAENRKDCIAFVSPKPTDFYAVDLEDATTYRTGLPSSSYGVMDSGYKLQYDRYNDVYVHVPLCGDVAGACVATDNVAEPWFSPAGFNRGRIQNLIRLGFNPTKTERDELYRRQINPVITYEGRGTVLFGDKTLLAKPSAFDRINVRRLFIVLEKAIATAADFLLFEFNDAATRRQFINLVEPYLRGVKAGRGITDFRVVCDESNNTPQVIDTNNFVGDIYIKPARSINFIQLNFIATPTGVSFSEVQGV
jgi:hypothetical protein